MKRYPAVLALAALAACRSEPSPPEAPVIGLYQVRGTAVEAGLRGMTASMTVLDAVLREQAEGVEVVRVIRDEHGAAPLFVDVEIGAFLERGDTTYNIRIQPGDTLEFTRPGD